MIFSGSEVRKILKNNADYNVRKCYLEYAEYIAQKLPLDNPFLRKISSINQELVMSKSKTVMKTLLSLPMYISDLLDDLELNEFDQEVRKICVD